ncbi:MAG: hypothetical protein GY774_04275 [Planctomycetes bacterium]|nr:hypothetical protein [Planctomycetota bacterium]
MNNYSPHPSPPECTSGWRTAPARMTLSPARAGSDGGWWPGVKDAKGAKCQRIYN